MPRLNVIQGPRYTYHIAWITPAGAKRERTYYSEETARDFYYSLRRKGVTEFRFATIRHDA